jgi:hypothetical protein
MCFEILFHQNTKYGKRIMGKLVTPMGNASVTHITPSLRIAAVMVTPV